MSEIWIKLFFEKKFLYYEGGVYLKVAGYRACGMRVVYCGENKTLPCEKPSNLLDKTRETSNQVILI